jgi:hypothetical protein
MAFSQEIVEQLLIGCHRHCCICHKPAGNKIEIHHIVPKSQGGDDSAGNGIPLCFDCHAEVGSYNIQHPKGRRFTSSELKKHKEQWFAICAKPPWDSTISVRLTNAHETVHLDENIFNSLRCDDRRPAERLVFAIMQQDRSVRATFIKKVFERLQFEKDEDTRWKAANVVEEILLWDPKMVSQEIIENMSKDRSFAVRSSAAVCYYYLAVIDPASVSLDILSKLAAYNEDWYVATPAKGALLRLARARPVVIDILARDLENKDVSAQESSAATIKRLIQKDWDLIPEELLTRMAQSSDSFIKDIGTMGLKKIKDNEKESKKDYSLF